jgi:protein-tyrosine phosphatase
MADAPGRPPAHAGFGAELRVDWLTPRDLGDVLPGRLGLTFLPGKRGRSSRYAPHVYRRDAGGDLAALRQQGVVRLVLLVDDDELARWGDRRIVELGRVAGVEVLRHPMPDGSPPASVDEAALVLSEITDGRSRGDVALACMGGVGRSGTIAACALVAAGLDARAAIRKVREVRHPEAVETLEQERFVEAFAARYRLG